MKFSKHMFDWDIVGNEQIVKYLQDSIINNKLSHAYLFLGPSKIGKKELALNFSKSILCYNYHLLKNEKKDKYPCNSCIHCFQFDKGIHPDINILAREYNEKTEKLKQNISIEQIRDIQEKLNQKAFLNLKKIAIIEEAEALSEAGSNSLLKTLEEPKSDTIIILLSAKQDSLLSTIKSRCQIFKMKPVAREKIYDYLISKGSLRDLAKEISSFSLGNLKSAKDSFQNAEALQKRDETVKKFIKILEGRLYEKMQIIDELVLGSDKSAIIQCIDVWQTVLRDLALIKLFLENDVANIKNIEKLKEMAQKLDIYKIAFLLDKLNQSKDNIERNVNSNLALENFALETNFKN